MNYLFIHQNFPGQYRHLVQDLARQSRHDVRFITQPNPNVIQGVKKISYERDSRGPINCHAYSVEIDRAIHAGASVATRCQQMRDDGFRPDLIVGHSGWGETLFVKDVFPDTPVLANFEFYYHHRGVDVGFDPEFVSLFHDPSRLRARNATNLLAFQSADWGHSATEWQRSLYPIEMRSRISVLHEGVDTDRACPRADASFQLPGSTRTLTRRDAVVTYVARNLEPYRGFHVFMRALPRLLRRRKDVQVVVVGGDGVSYGTPPAPRTTYRDMMLAELEGKLDLSRVHFVGTLDYAPYLSLLQISSAHVYLTYPFVLSWSFIEAMACGCLIIGSDTPPVQEVLVADRNGLAVDCLDHEQLSLTLERVLEKPDRFQRHRAAARATAVERYDLKRQLLPRWYALFDDLVHGRQPDERPRRTMARGRRG